jgi:hypothetical protein
MKKNSDAKPERRASVSKNEVKASRASLTPSIQKKKAMTEEKSTKDHKQKPKASAKQKPSKTPEKSKKKTVGAALLLPKKKKISEFVIDAKLEKKELAQVKPKLFDLGLGDLKTENIDEIMQKFEQV